MHKDFSDNNDLSLEPIPKWITSYGFTALVVIALLVTLFSFFLKVPETLSVDVHVTNEKIYTTCKFEEYQAFTNVKEVLVTLPFTDTIRVGKLLVNEKWIEGDQVYIPINISEIRKSIPEFNNEIILSGVVTVDKSPLFYKLLEK